MPASTPIKTIPFLRMFCSLKINAPARNERITLLRLIAEITAISAPGMLSA